MAREAPTTALDRLFTAPLEGFLALRKQLVAQARSSGDAPGARAIAAIAKPTRTAWALNQVARSRPELLQALLEARSAAANPSAGDADGLRRALRDHRDRLNDVVRAASEALAATGVELNAQQSRRLAETLQATTADEGDARAQLLAGRLTHDVAVDDPFAGVAGGEASEPRAPSPAPPAHAPAARASEPIERPKADREEQARKKAEEAERARRERAEREARDKHAQAVRAARARIDELQTAAHAARVEAHVAHDVATHAARKAREADDAVKAIEARLAEAREALERLG